MSGSELPSPSELVKRYQRRARKSFGQHFLTDAALLDRIVASVGEVAGAHVLEIGPGPGGLTVRLLAAGALVTCLEADRDMVAHLGDNLGHRDDLVVLQGDATSSDLEVAFSHCAPPPTLVVANLPYNAASPIVVALADRDAPPQRMALMFQLEVAQRIVAAGPGPDFGSLGVLCNLRYATRIAMKVPRGAFVPPPKVQSAVVRFDLRVPPLCPREVELAARRVARTAFNQRRKMLRKSLLPLGVGAEELCERAAIDPTARPESLDVAAFVRMGEALLAVRGPSDSA